MMRMAVRWRHSALKMGLRLRVSLPLRAACYTATWQLLDSTQALSKRAVYRVGNNTAACVW
jgi:hypothetical protein